VWWLPRLIALFVAVVFLGYAFLHAIGPTVCESWETDCGGPDAVAKANRLLMLGFGFMGLVIAEWVWAYRRRRRRR